MLSCVPGVCGETPVPPKKHAERITYDPQAGWIRTPEPTPGTEDGDLDIARQWAAREDYKTALKVLEPWIKTYGVDSPRYPEALYLKGTAHLELGDYRSARDAYQALLNDFPGSDYAEQALSGQFRVAEQYLAGKRRSAWWGLLRVRDYDAGIEIMDDLIVNYSDTPLAELAQMAKAEYYFSRSEFELAEEQYAIFARDYPRSRWHPRALLKSAEAALASFPGVQFDDAGLLEARERFLQFLRLYPAAAEQQGVAVILEQIAATRADKTYEIASFYEKTGHPSAARFYYRAAAGRWPDTPAAAQARGRLAVLGEPAGPDAGQAPGEPTADLPAQGGG